MTPSDLLVALAGEFASDKDVDTDPPLIERDDVDYVSFDLYAPHAMVRGDLCAAPFADDTPLYLRDPDVTVPGAPKRVVR